MVRYYPLEAYVPRKPISENERIQMVLDRFSMLREGKGLFPIKTLAEKYHREPAVISRAIAAAFRDGLVEIRPVDRLRRDPRRHLALEQRLLEAYPTLLAAIVVQSETPAPNEYDDDAERIYDDVHARLGQALAHYIVSGPLLRDGDRIGLSGGRAIYHCVDAMLHLAPLRASSVVLASLTGLNHARHRSRNNWRAFRLDADTHVQLLGQSFTTEPMLKLLSFPLVLDDAAEKERVWTRVWLGSPGQWGWGKEPLNQGIAGVGSLAPGHHFFQAFAEGVLGEDHVWLPIHGELKELIELCQAETTGTYCPVGDIANRFFFVPPPKGRMIPAHRFEKLIEAINSRLLTVSLEQLRAIPSLVLVAGTRIKARAIQTLLDDRNMRVKYLCTDHAAADLILQNRDR